MVARSHALLTALCALVLAGGRGPQTRGPPLIGVPEGTRLEVWREGFETYALLHFVPIRPEWRAWFVRLRERRISSTNRVEALYLEIVRVWLLDTRPCAQRAIPVIQQRVRWGWRRHLALSEMAGGWSLNGGTWIGLEARPGGQWTEYRLRYARGWGRARCGVGWNYPIVCWLLVRVWRI